MIKETITEWLEPDGSLIASAGVDGYITFEKLGFRIKDSQELIGVVEQWYNEYRHKIPKDVGANLD